MQKYVFAFVMETHASIQSYTNKENKQFISSFSSLVKEGSLELFIPLGPVHLETKDCTYHRTENGKGASMIV